MKKVYGDEHPQVAHSLSHLGSVWDAVGEYKKAVECYEQAERMFSDTLGREHPSTQDIKDKIKRAQEHLDQED